MILVRPPGTIFPRAVATISTVLNPAQASAKQKNAMITAPIARPTGEGGFSTISSAAGRNAVSYSPRRACRSGNGMIFLTDFMDSRLQVVQLRVAAAGANQLVVRAVLDDSATLDGDNAIGAANGRKSVSNEKHGSALADPPHVVLDDAFALVIERARCLIEDQNSRIHDQGTGDGNPLPLPAGQAAAALADDRAIAFGQLQDELVRAGQGCGCNHPLHRHRRVRERDVVAHR